jgi:hypothetical protein
MFQCGTLTSSLRAFADIKLQYRKNNLDRLIGSETMLGIETQCITTGEQTPTLDRDEDLIQRIVALLD